MCAAQETPSHGEKEMAVKQLMLKAKDDIPTQALVWGETELSHVNCDIAAALSSVRPTRGQERRTEKRDLQNKIK